MIRDDYKGGPKECSEQRRWQEVVFGSPKPHGGPRAHRGFLQLGALVGSGGRFVRNSNVRWLAAWDRPRTIRLRDNDPPVETLCLAMMGQLRKDGSVGIEVGRNGQAFDFMRRPFARYQASTLITTMSELRLPSDVPYDGKITLSVTEDGKNFDIGDGRYIFLRLNADRVFGPKADIDISDVPRSRLVPGFSVEVEWPDRSAVLATCPGRIQAKKTHWRNGKPVMTEPTVTLDMASRDGRDLMRHFCDLMAHANKVAAGDGQFRELITPSAWLPRPYVGFESRMALDTALLSDKFVPTKELLSDLTAAVVQSGVVELTITDVPAKVEFVSQAPGHGPEWSLVGFYGAQPRRVPIARGVSVLCVQEGREPEQIDSLEDLVGRSLTRCRVILPASSSQVESEDALSEAFPDAWQHICAAFVMQSRHTAGSHVVVPAAYVPGGVSTNSELYWDFSTLEKFDTLRAGLYLCPPIYGEFSRPTELKIGGVSLFLGTHPEHEARKAMSVPRHTPTPPAPQPPQQEAVTEEAAVASSED